MIGPHWAQDLASDFQVFLHRVTRPEAARSSASSRRSIISASLSACAARSVLPAARSCSARFRHWFGVSTDVVLVSPLIVPSLDLVLPFRILAGVDLTLILLGHRLSKASIGLATRLWERMFQVFTRNRARYAGELNPAAEAFALAVLDPTSFIRDDEGWYLNLKDFKRKFSAELEKRRRGLSKLLAMAAIPASVSEPLRTIWSISKSHFMESQTPLISKSNGWRRITYLARADAIEVCRDPIRIDFHVMLLVRLEFGER